MVPATRLWGVLDLSDLGPVRLLVVPVCQVFPLPGAVPGGGLQDPGPSEGPPWYFLLSRTDPPPPDKAGSVPDAQVSSVFETRMVPEGDLVLEFLVLRTLTHFGPSSRDTSFPPGSSLTGFPRTPVSCEVGRDVKGN